MSSPFHFLEELSVRTERFDRELESFLVSMPQETPLQLWESMTYSLKAGGKRVRPVLCLEAAQLFGATWEEAFPLALAFEMVHTASLIHDDLPAMDDDVLRRGKPTNHVVFGEALALIAGDALLCFAFETAIGGPGDRAVASDRALKAVCELASALGPAGMCGGQVLDMDQHDTQKGPEYVEALASGKTMRLIQAALTSGARLGNVTEQEMAQMSSFGAHLGLAFQIADDVLDVVGSQEQMGKTLGKDAQQQKHTFVHVLGLEGARERLQRETRLALDALSFWPGEEAQFLRAFALYLEQRKN